MAAGSESGIIGRRAEIIALRYLKSSGLTEVTTNFQCRMGEIDLVMKEGNCLVFAEVRFRKHNRFTTAAGSVDQRKQRKLMRAAAAFLVRHPEYGSCTVRFDVVGLDRSGDQTRLEWIRDAFRPE